MVRLGGKRERNLDLMRAWERKGLEGVGVLEGACSRGCG